MMMAKKFVCLCFVAVCRGFEGFSLRLRRTPRMSAASGFEARELGALECLFLPRRSLETCSLPPTVHVCCGVVDRVISDEEALARLASLVRKHVLLGAKVRGDGVPPQRGPLGAPLAESDLKYELSPFGDDNMRVGRPANPLQFVPMDATPEEIAKLAMEPTVVQGIGIGNDDDDDDLEAAWKEAFAMALDCRGGSALLFGGGEKEGRFDFDTRRGPLWRCKLFRGSERSVVLFGFDHAVSDQPSAMAVLEDFAAGTSSSLEQRSSSCPPSLEDAILSKQGGVSRGFVSEDLGGKGLLALDKGSFSYLASKLWGERDASLPMLFSDKADIPKARDRRTILEWRSLGDVANLRDRARREGTTVGGALAAAACHAFASATAGAAVTQQDKKKKILVLQSLDMRRFAVDYDDSETLACHAGSMDLVLDTSAGFWANARAASKQLKAFVDKGFGVDSVRVFDWATDAMEMTRLVELQADNPHTKGRAYATGISNAGVFESKAKVVTEAYYATSTAYAGAAFQAYALTLDGALRACFSTVVADEAHLETYADAFQRALSRAVDDEDVKEGGAASSSSFLPPPKPPSSTNAYAYALAGATLGALPHVGAWTSFFEAVGRAYDGVGGRVSELVAPFGFWLFFAVTHPLVGGAGVALGELAWQFPGYVPEGGGENLDAVGPPIAFTALLTAASTALLSRPATRAVAAFFATLWFSAYVSAGVAGTSTDLASYNLALDDAPYPSSASSSSSLTTKTVRGCPSYVEVADPKVASLFDAEKYQGTWYEHAYHDWTQFSEVYDTRLDISLDDPPPTTKGETTTPTKVITWLDVFRVKGPSPKAAPHSWRGSPVANGAAYPLYGTLRDLKTPSLDELGFGNSFPNYVVDLQTDPKTGEYTEAIQFQCLDAGGVRVFEGINFLSREPEMSDASLDAMFARAAKIAPYGATKDQMHLIDHNVPPLKPIDNWWQRAWKTIGFDDLLELIAKDL